MFEELLNRYPWDMVEDKIYSSTDRDFKAVLYSDFKSPEDFFPMFSPAADRYLEEMAILSTRSLRTLGQTLRMKICGRPWKPGLIPRCCTGRLSRENWIRNPTCRR